MEEIGKSKGKALNKNNWYKDRPKDQMDGAPPPTTGRKRKKFQKDGGRDIRKRKIQAHR